MYDYSTIVRYSTIPHDLHVYTTILSSDAYTVELRSMVMDVAEHILASSVGANAQASPSLAGAENSIRSPMGVSG